MKLIHIAVTTGFVAAASVAFAAVNFDASTGTGFVGKGDVQLAFSWNNSALQKNAAATTFSYNARDTYDVECEWTTTTGKGKEIYHDITIPKHVAINASVAYDARVKNQITGFNLNGFGTVQTTGEVPVEGGSCPGNHPGVITAVTSTGSTGGLHVNYGNLSVPLPNTPPATTTTTTQ